MEMVGHDYVRDRIGAPRDVLRANVVHKGAAVTEISEVRTSVERDGSDEIDVCRP